MARSMLPMGIYGHRTDRAVAEAEVRRGKQLLHRICRDKPLRFGYERLTVAMFARAIKTVNAARILATGGYAEDGQSLLRVAYELYQHIAYLNVDPQESQRRAKVFGMERQLERYEDAKFYDSTGLLGRHGLRHRLVELRARHDQIMKEPEFYIPPGEKRPRKPRWRTLQAKPRQAMVLRLWDRLDPSQQTRNLGVINYCYSVIGNRRVHMSPSGLDPKQANNRGSFA